MKVSGMYRLMALVARLQGRKSYTPDELAEELCVSKRTIFRDLNMLEMAHIPYYFDSDHGGYRIGEHFFLPPVNLTLGEAMAVMVMTSRLDGKAQLPLLAQGAQAAVKIESVLPPEIRKQLGQLVENLHFSLGAIATHDGLDETFDELARAAADNRVCRIVYNSFYEGEQITTQVHPYRLLFQSRAWYLIAHSQMHNQRRTFKLSRIGELTVTDKTFTPPDKSQLDRPFGDAWAMIPEGKLYNVHLHFSPMVAGNVAEVQWHHSQKIEFNDDGSIEFRADVDGLREISWWVQGYGDQVEVVAPASLAKKVLTAAEAVVAKYKKGAN